MEATFIIKMERQRIERVDISSEAFDPPFCSEYYTNGYGFPFRHGFAVICYKYGTMNF